ncbi:hypothetical protein [Actinomadura atramentaria]|uniref:hypothetical protein n=1 Tax=Actinomadura atramentaria TaxID=1990 RepID=UPI0003765A0C|nr:hypothetical protein [Actinomadura atramentaria]
MTIMSLVRLAAGSLFAVSALASPAHAASNATPTYEVKINLTSAALDASHDPTSAVKSAFGITGSAAARSGIEVVPIGSEYVVELSLKTDDYDDAATLHSDAIAVADAHGWLYHGDVLKTQLVLDQY